MKHLIDISGNLVLKSDKKQELLEEYITDKEEIKNLKECYPKISLQINLNTLMETVF